MALPVRRGEGAGARTTERWAPFRELEDLHEQTAHLLERAWSGAGLSDPRAWVPLVDIEETDDAWLLEAELPGVDPKDVNVELRDSELEISGEIKERERKGILRRKTRRVGRFEFRVTLPGQTDPEQVDAKLSDGVLRVRIPKPDQARPRRIAVQMGEQ